MIVVNSDILKFWFNKLGLNAGFFSTYESASKSILQNLPEVVNNLHEAFVKRDKIVIVSDFDTDGIMSGLIGCSGLTELGFNVSLYEPNPENGYGFHVSDVVQIYKDCPDVKVVLTADVGISANEAIDFAHGLGIKVWVTDHHLSSAKCGADITVNPNQLGESYDQPNICGAFVLYKVLESYAVLYADRSKQLYIYCLRLFAGIATVADTMPLTGENRQLVRDTVSLLQSLYSGKFLNYSNSQSVFSGVVAILKCLRENNKLSCAGDITEEFLGFYFVPLLNSVKRMCGDMRGIYDIFFCRNGLPSDVNANNLRVNSALSYLFKLNDDRKTLTASWFEYIIANRNSVKCNVFITDAPKGLLGLLAIRLMNLSGLPTLVLRYDAVKDSYHGSGRSPDWFHFPNEIKQAGLRITAEGHAGAFGINCPSSQTLNEYYAFYNTVVLKAYDNLPKDYAVPEIIINDNVNSDDIKFDFMFSTNLIREYLEEYENFCPWGAGFKPPQFKLCLNAGFKAKLFGSTLQHVKFITDNGLEVLLFNKASVCEIICDKNGYIDGIICVTGKFMFNSFNGAKTIVFFANYVDKIERSVTVC